MTDRQALDVVVHAIGWALLHSVWQGAFIAGVTALLLLALHRSAPGARYLVACLGFAVIVTSWVWTAVHVGRTVAPTAQARDSGAVVAAVDVELGPAGPLHLTPAIRPLRGLDRFDDKPEVTWQQRLDAGSVALVPVWLAGVLVLSARLALAWVVVERLRRAAISPASASLRARVEALAGRLGIRRVVRVAQSAIVQVPTAIGWLRPVVLLPARALTGLTVEQLDAVLAHELAHIRRHDFAVNVLQNAGEIILFYHPACWWLSRRIRIEREHCCDDVAVALCGDRIAYATALADLESLRTEPTLALAATDGLLLQRVRRVIAAVPDERAASGWIAAAAALAVVTLLIMCAQAAGMATADPGGDQTSVPTPARIIPADEGVIQGRVVDARSGHPISGAAVQIAGIPGTATATTDAEGRYEATALKPGSYKVTVTAKGYVEGPYGPGAAALMDFGANVEVRGGHLAAGIDVRLQGAGNISGRITDPQGRGLSGVEVELLAEKSLPNGSRPVAVAFAQTIEDGVYQMRDLAPGDYYLRAYTSQDASPGAGATLAYAATFYPSVPSAGVAQRLRLYAGQELLYVDVALATTRKFSVSGRVVDPSEPLPGDLRVRLQGKGLGGIRPDDEGSSVIDGEGRFAIPDVIPGDYLLTVLDRRGTPRWLSALQTLSVDADVAGLELRAAIGARVVGRVVRDPQATTSLDVAGVRFGLGMVVARSWGSVTWGASKIDADGSFSMESPGGPVSIEVGNVPAGWMVKSISLDGTEIGDEPVDLGSGLRQVQVMLTDRVSAVSGVVVDRNGRTLPNYAVVIFPRDPTRWQPSSRFILAARSNNAGQFRIEAVPPGEYLAVAVTALSMNAWVNPDWTNPDVLARLRTGAERLRIGEGERLTISIRASPTPDA